MTTHRLKTWPAYFKAVSEGKKRFELRVNDRNFHVGDFLHLEEWNPENKSYTGSFVDVCVQYIAQGVFGLPDNLCVMSISEPLTDPRWYCFYCDAQVDEGHIKQVYDRGAQSGSCHRERKSSHKARIGHSL